MRSGTLATMATEKKAKAASRSDLLAAIELVEPTQTPDVHRLLGALFLVDRLEPSGDPAVAAAWVAEFKLKYSMGWPTLVLGDVGRLASWLRFSGHPANPSDATLRELAQSFDRRWEAPQAVASSPHPPAA